MIIKKPNGIKYPNQMNLLIHIDMKSINVLTVGCLPCPHYHGVVDTHAHSFSILLNRNYRNSRVSCFYSSHLLQVTGNPAPLFHEKVPIVRPPKSDQYGIYIQYAINAYSRKTAVNNKLRFVH